MSDKEGSNRREVRYVTLTKSISIPITTASNDEDAMRIAENMDMEGKLKFHWIEEQGMATDCIRHSIGDEG